MIRKYAVVVVLVSLCAVCASTSVSAAVRGGTSASVQATPNLVGAPIAAGTGPAACVLQGTSTTYVFVKGGDGALWYRIWSTFAQTWNGAWTSLGGQLTSSPAAVSPHAGAIDVYVRGADGTVYEKSYDISQSPQWQEGYYKVGGQVAPNTGPAVCSYGAVREDVFVEGTYGALYQITCDLSVPRFSSWTKLYGTLTSSPTATTLTANNKIDMSVFVRGNDGFLYQNEYYSAVLDGPGNWSGWTPPFDGPPS